MAFGNACLVVGILLAVVCSVRCSQNGVRAAARLEKSHPDSWRTLSGGGGLSRLALRYRLHQFWFSNRHESLNDHELDAHVATLKRNYVGMGVGAALTILGAWLITSAALG